MGIVHDYGKKRGIQVWGGHGNLRSHPGSRLSVMKDVDRANSMLPGWNELSRVTRFERLLRETGIWLLAGGVITELIALLPVRLIERKKTYIEVFGICLFLLLAGAEHFELLYSTQRDLLLDTPRLLSSAEQTELTGQLAPLDYQGIAVFWIDHDFEAADFGKSIITALNATKHFNGAGVTEGNYPDAIIEDGLTVEVPDINHPGIAANTLFTFLKKHGLEPHLFQTRTKVRLQDRWIQVRIRRKPRG